LKSVDLREKQGREKGKWKNEFSAGLPGSRAQQNFPEVLEEDM
jgi:hypothetical protein